MKLRFITTAFTLLVVAVVTDIDTAFLHADEQVTNRDRAWIEKRIQDWQPTQAERAFDQIGWAPDLLTAEKLAKEHGRLIFLFTYDGASMACYRC